MKDHGARRQRTLLDLIAKLAERQQKLANFVTMAEMTFVLNSAKHLVDHDEEGVAFENLVDNLYELSFPLTEHDYQTLDGLGRDFGFPDDTWTMLRELVTD